MKYIIIDDEVIFYEEKLIKINDFVLTQNKESIYQASISDADDIGNVIVKRLDTVVLIDDYVNILCVLIKLIDIPTIEILIKFKESQL